LNFEFKQNESLFTISAFTKEQWTQLGADNDLYMSSRKLGFNDKYVFMYDQAQDGYPSFGGRYSDLEGIIKTFKIE
jgi:hypothetical protein